MTSRAVPLLPAIDIDAVSAMWQALGFSVLFNLRRPRPYLALRSDEGLELHYFANDQLVDREDVIHGSCVFVVPDPSALLTQWQEVFDHLPDAAHRARLVVPRAEAVTQHGFSLIDPAGNRIRVMRGAGVEAPEPAHVPTPAAPAAPALAPPDPATAVAGLGAPGNTPPVRASAYERHGLAAAPHHRFSALIYLAELSVRLDRFQDAKSYLDTAEGIMPDSPVVADVRAELERRLAD